MDLRVAFVTCLGFMLVVFICAYGLLSLVFLITDCLVVSCLLTFVGFVAVDCLYLLGFCGLSFGLLVCRCFDVGLVAV